MKNIRIVGTPEAVRAKTRLEYLRGEIEAKRISYGEIAELQSLVEYIEPGDALLLEWAGVCEDCGQSPCKYLDDCETKTGNRCEHQETTSTVHGEYCLDCHAYL